MIMRATPVKALWRGVLARRVAAPGAEEKTPVEAASKHSCIWRGPKQEGEKQRLVKSDEKQRINPDLLQRLCLHYTIHHLLSAALAEHKITHGTRKVPYRYTQKCFGVQ